MDAQLKKGVLEMCILFCIEKEELYGYDIMQRMHQYFPDVSESTVYAILRRLHAEGASETYIGAVSNGPARKYYRITELGRENLANTIQDWNQISTIIKEMGISSL